MALKILFIGGTGQISYPCVERAVACDGPDTETPADVIVLTGNNTVAATGTGETYNFGAGGGQAGIGAATGTYSMGRVNGYLVFIEAMHFLPRRLFRFADRLHQSLRSSCGSCPLSLV